MLSETSKFDGNSLSLQRKNRGGGGPPILLRIERLQIIAKNAHSNQTNDLKTLAPISRHPKQFSETIFPCKRWVKGPLAGYFLHAK